MDAPFHLPSPPTLEQRLDAAAEAMFEDMFGCKLPEDAMLTSEARDSARLILTAAFPELFSDPPTAKIISIAEAEEAEEAEENKRDLQNLVAAARVCFG